MQVQNIECQLAQVQLKRYLAGESIADELLADLERHLEECGGCRSAAKVMRAAAGATASTPAESSPEEATAKPKFSLGSLIKKPSASAVVRPVGEKKDNRKTLILSASLAVVLILMSTVLKDPTKLFGAKAADTVAKTEQDTPPTEPPTENIETIKDETKTGEAEPEDLAGAAFSAAGLEATEDEPEPTVEETAPPVVNNEESKPKTETTKESTGTASSKPTQTESGLNIPGRPTLQDQPVVEVGKKEPVKPAARPAAKPPVKRTVRRAPRKSSGAAAKSGSGNSIRIYDRNGKPVK